MPARILWTTIPEKLTDPATAALSGVSRVRKPTTCVTASSAQNGRALLELHPFLADVQCINFGDSAPAGALAFQPPGEGPWRVFPVPDSIGPFQRFPYFESSGDARQRMDAAITAAYFVGQQLAARKPNCCIWDVGGAYSGVIAIGIARAVGRCTVVAVEGPDRLAIAFADKHSVELRPVLNMRDQRLAREFLKEF